MLWIMSVSLFGFYRPTPEFLTHGYVTIAGEELHILTYAPHALMAIEQWGFINVPHLLWHGPTFIMVISKDPWHSHHILRYKQNNVSIVKETLMEH